ncbi:hypothetical protein [Actinocatenispora rupis]|uniref:Uncharacterized protein n=1 Tax=Actinocatenispora rupis TaxID=519421 RepID=A0A8J3J4Y2_9ACTN|nr:hypothetical protein [Actinocatenispora rupis]GID10212.1 hypothetical protein Aru02nite_11010 [Actinocatenispora rupis]
MPMPVYRIELTPIPTAEGDRAVELHTAAAEYGLGRLVSLTPGQWAGLAVGCPPATPPSHDIDAVIGWLVDRLFNPARAAECARRWAAAVPGASLWAACLAEEADRLDLRAQPCGYGPQGADCDALMCTCPQV